MADPLNIDSIISRLLEGKLDYTIIPLFLLQTHNGKIIEKSIKFVTLPTRHYLHIIGSIQIQDIA